MHDVVGEILLPIGDEDLRAKNSVGAVWSTLGAGAQRG
jgi:hypothetical protein